MPKIYKHIIIIDEDSIDENGHANNVNYVQWMQDLEYYFETKEYIFVHAGLNFNNTSPFTDKYSMLWIRDFEVIPEKVGFKKIIHGHVPVSHEFVKAVNQTK